MKAEARNDVFVRLYRLAGVFALTAGVLWPLTFLAQAFFVAEHTESGGLWAQGFQAALSYIFERIKNDPLVLGYDVTHMPGMPVISVVAWNWRSRLRHSSRWWELRATATITICVMSIPYTGFSSVRG